MSRKSIDSAAQIPLEGRGGLDFVFVSRPARSHEHFRDPRNGLRSRLAWCAPYSKVEKQRGWIHFGPNSPADLLSVGTAELVGTPSAALERPERPIGRGVDGLAGLGISAEMEAEEPLIIMDGPAHEGVVMSDRVGSLDRGREGVQRDEVGRDIRQVGR